MRFFEKIQTVLVIFVRMFDFCHSGTLNILIQYQKGKFSCLYFTDKKDEYWEGQYVNFTKEKWTWFF